MGGSNAQAIAEKVSNRDQTKEDHRGWGNKKNFIRGGEARLSQGILRNLAYYGGEEGRKVVGGVPSTFTENPKGGKNLIDGVTRGYLVIRTVQGERGAGMWE